MRCSSLILSATTSVKIYLNNHLSLTSSGFSEMFDIWMTHFPFYYYLLKKLFVIRMFKNITQLGDSVDTARDLGCNYYVKILIGRCDGINE